MKHRQVKPLIVAALAIILFSAAGVRTIYHDMKNAENDVVALAMKEKKDFKWNRQTAGSGTTIDAAYLWPDEANPKFTSVYRDGKAVTEKMITVTDGSVYHFWGTSDASVLYTEVYVGGPSSIDITSGETGTWYRLLPSAIRKDFEESGWKWETGWEYSGRAYLDLENNRIMIKNNDHTAVLYGMGLYLDNKHDYKSDPAFEQENEAFKTAFGETESLFASALEYYYTKGGELRSKCPKIYAMIADALSQMDTETAKIRQDTTVENSSEKTSEHNAEPVLMKELLMYVNERRSESGLSALAWDAADDENCKKRVLEISTLFSQTRPDGSDAFSAYTDAVMSEMRLENVTSTEEIFDNAISYFLSPDIISFNCASYNNMIILIFTW